MNGSFSLLVNFMPAGLQNCRATRLGSSSNDQKAEIQDERIVSTWREKLCDEVRAAERHAPVAKYWAFTSFLENGSRAHSD